MKPPAPDPGGYTTRPEGALGRATFGVTGSPGNDGNIYDVRWVEGP